MRTILRRRMIPAGLLTLGVLAYGCGNLGFFSPELINTLSGGVVPFTPGPAAAFVLVRAANETGQTAEFIVTIERSVRVLDDAGNVQLDDAGLIITRQERETRRLITGATGRAAEVGTLFPCGDTPVTVVGLGRNLDANDTAVFVGGGGATGAAGTGIPVGDLNPLQLSVGNFNCGDTIIFRAFVDRRIGGGVGLQTLLLPGSEQPDEFLLASTFANYAAFLEAQQVNEEP